VNAEGQEGKKKNANSWVKGKEKKTSHEFWEKPLGAGTLTCSWKERIVFPSEGWGGRARSRLTYKTEKLLQGSVEGGSTPATRRKSPPVRPTGEGREERLSYTSTLHGKNADGSCQQSAVLVFESRGKTEDRSRSKRAPSFYLKSPYMWKEPPLQQATAMAGPPGGKKKKKKKEKAFPPYLICSPEKGRCGYLPGNRSKKLSSVSSIGGE